MILTQEYKEQWSVASKLFFRFIFSYFTFYFVLTFLGAAWETPIRWVASNILDIQHEFSSNGQGSGDTTYAYVTLFIVFSVSILLTFIWSVADRKRTSYNKLFYWFLVVLRIFLVFTMLSYGMVKIYKIQFPSASLMRLLQPLGEFSPMGLAWTYMGYSEGFNMFTGFLEVLGGLLLIPRRTQTLGSFLVIGVMTHVLVMNLMFDIPVKLLSSHIVLMATVIFITDSKRFVNLFIRNRSTTQYNYYHPIKNKTYHKAILWIKVILLALYLGIAIVQGYTTERKLRDKRPKPELYGIWEAQIFIRNNDTLPPLITDKNRWRYLVIDVDGRASVKMMDDHINSFSFTVDTIANSINMDSQIENENNFSYLKKGKDTLILEGELYYNPLKIYLIRKDHTKFPLKNRGFRWINEYPYNR